MPSGSHDAQPSTGETDAPANRVAGVVGIGASAGGLEALEELFGAVPVDTGLAFIIVQHLSPDFKSHMDELLGRRTEMAVRVIQDGDRIAANTLYLLPPRKEVVLDQWHLRLTDKQTGGGLNLPIDRMFQSLAGHDCGRVAVVVLSGTGSDGSQGLQDVARHGGLVLCQDEHTATFDGMPLKAQATGCVDLVLAPESIAESLQRFAVMNDKADVVRSLQDEITSTDFSGVLDELHQEYGIDFSQYKQTTVNRRLARRLARCNVEDAKQYERQLAKDPHELARLYHDLLIGVTQFYRDPEGYDALERLVITRLVDQVEGDQEIRVWVAGCATGEEAYSTAMLLQEHLDRAATSATFRLFATDMHPESLRIASLGVYSEEAAESIPASRRRRFFRKTPRGYQVNEELRERIVFATHNVAGDAPFTNLDLITCRNLLIYLQDAAQERVLTHFHFSLKPRGHLFLGPSESLGPLAPGFDTLDAHWKLFCKAGPLPQHRVIRPRPPQVRPIRAATPKRIRPQSDRALSLSYDRLLDFFMPPSLLVDEEMMLLQVFGDADALLRISRGRISGLVQDILVEPLRMPVVAALQHARRENIPVQYGEVRVAADSGQRLYKITVRPIPHAAIATTHYLVQFDREAAAPKSSDQPAIQLRNDTGDGEVSRIRSLEHELDFTRENLQATVEELETTNEELQSTNEELTSSNEELQSTNEELHSVNEELHTVNSEHQRKIIELTELTNDIENLLVSTDVGLLFLDHDLRLRRFTPRIADAMRLSHEDMGRRISTFADVLKGVNLLEESFRVLGGADPVTVEVQDDRDRPFLLQVRPYRADSRNTGVVITLVDLTLVKQAETDLRKSRNLVSRVLESITEAFFSLDDDWRFTFINPAAQRLLNVDAAQLLGEPFRDVLTPQSCQFVRRRLEEVQRSQQAVRFEMELEHLQRWYDVRCFPVDGGLSVFLSDATARRETEQYLQKARRAAEQANRAKSDFLANMSHEIRTPMTAILGFSEIALRQLDAGEAVDPEHLKTVKRNGQYLLRIIDDILDLSKIEAGKLDVRISQFGLFEFIREVEKLVSFRAAQTGVPLTIELVGMLPETIYTDRGRVEQILANLLGNAIKFTETGCVRLRVSYAVQAAEPQLRFEVIDTGIGIPQDKQRQLFTPFAQAHVEGFGRRFGGTGLGLSISRRLAALLGGDISLKSDEGVGSTFALTLPIGDAWQIHLVSPPEIDRLEPSPSNPGTELQQLNLRVLIADDMRDVRMVAKHFLSKSGATVTMVENGQAAVDAVQRSVEEGVPFDVILMDMQMPIMNGYEATRVLRRLGHEMPIIALTAAAMRTELSEAIQAGCDEHMTKPIHGPQLVGRVASRVHQHRQKNLSSPAELRRSASD